MQRRIKLTIAYDGTRYHGWQIQENSLTVEEIINKALSSLFKTEIKVIGASRTDSGVHALGNVAVFDTFARIPAEKIAYALNQRLPEDIVIQESVEVALSFHPRYTNCTKTYEYKIYNAEFQMPIQRQYKHLVYVPLDLEKMQEAAKAIVGTHDFKSFCSARTQVLTTTRTIYELQLEKIDDTITIRISGNGFLYNMVRIIVGTLIKVGRGKIDPQSISDIILSKDRTKAGPVAPANGLTLVKIDYD